MGSDIRVALAGVGAFGLKHLDGMKNIQGVQPVALVGRRLEPTQEAAKRYGKWHRLCDGWVQRHANHTDTVRITHS